MHFQSVLVITNKDNRGYITPEEFNRLAEQAQERSRRLQLGSDASSAADKRKFNADVRAAALQLEVEQLKAANLKRVMSLSDGPPSVKAFQDASRPGAFLSFQEANERIGTLGMEGTTAAPRARPMGTNMMDLEPMGKGQGLNAKNNILNTLY